VQYKPYIVQGILIILILLFVGGRDAYAQFHSKRPLLNSNLQLLPTLSKTKVQSLLRLKPAPKLDGVNGFKYEAFFCRMEQRSIDKLGFCIQIHAGDYNNYYKDKRYLDR